MGKTEDCVGLENLVEKLAICTNVSSRDLEVVRHETVSHFDLTTLYSISSLYLVFVITLYQCRRSQCLSQS